MKNRANVNRVLTWPSVALGIATLVGCGGQYDSSVSGVATLNGSPLPAGTRVIFNPAQTGPLGYGMIDDSGSYSVMTGREEGLPSGEYVVTVVANQPSVPNKNSSLPPTPGKPLTPAWYRSPDKSPLRYTVDPGSNEINLELDAQPPTGLKPSGRT